MGCHQQSAVESLDHLVQQDNGNRGNFGFRAGNWKLQRHDSKSARNVLVEAKDDGITLVSTDLDLSIRTRGDADVGADHTGRLVRFDSLSYAGDLRSWFARRKTVARTGQPRPLLM